MVKQMEGITCAEGKWLLYLFLIGERVMKDVQRKVLEVLKLAGLENKIQDEVDKQNV